MFGMIGSVAFGLIKAHWKKLAGIGAILLIAAVIYFQHWENSRLQSKVATQAASLRVYQQNEKKYQNTIADQNASIDALKAKSDALKKKVDQSSKTINSIQNNYNQKINKLESEQAPKDCKGAMKYMLNHAGGG